MKKLLHRLPFVLLTVVSMSLISCDGLALVELPDQMLHDTTYVLAVDTTQLAPIVPFQHAFWFDGNAQLFGFCTLDSINSLYYDYTRESGSYTYVKTGRISADVVINFAQRNSNTYYYDVYDLALTFLTPCGGILNGTQTRTIKTKNPNTYVFTTQSSTITNICDANFSYTLWIGLVREGL